MWWPKNFKKKRTKTAEGEPVFGVRPDGGADCAGSAGGPAWIDYDALSTAQGL